MCSASKSPLLFCKSYIGRKQTEARVLTCYVRLVGRQDTFSSTLWLIAVQHLHLRMGGIHAASWSVVLFTFVPLYYYFILTVGRDLLNLKGEPT